jgi:hypothetical protein
MRTGNLQSLARLLQKQPGELKALLAHAARLESLSRQISAWLPEPLAEHARVANVDPQRLVLQTDSPAWATRLRYLAPPLLAYLKQQPDLAGLLNVQVRIRPAASGTADRPGRRPQFSRLASESLQAAAEGHSDAELRDALIRLAEHVHPPPDPNMN